MGTWALDVQQCRAEEESGGEQQVGQGCVPALQPRDAAQWGVPWVSPAPRCWDGKTPQSPPLPSLPKKCHPHHATPPCCPQGRLTAGMSTLVSIHRWGDTGMGTKLHSHLTQLQGWAPWAGPCSMGTLPSPRTTGWGFLSLGTYIAAMLPAPSLRARSALQASPVQLTGRTGHPTASSGWKHCLIFSTAWGSPASSHPTARKPQVQTWSRV